MKRYDLGSPPSLRLRGGGDTDDEEEMQQILTPPLEEFPEPNEEDRRFIEEHLMDIDGSEIYRRASYGPDAVDRAFEFIKDSLMGILSHNQSRSADIYVSMLTAHVIRKLVQTMYRRDSNRLRTIEEI